MSVSTAGAVNDKGLAGSGPNSSLTGSPAIGALSLANLVVGQCLRRRPPS